MARLEQASDLSPVPAGKVAQKTRAQMGGLFMGCSRSRIIFFAQGRLWQQCHCLAHGCAKGLDPLRASLEFSGQVYAQLT